MSTVVNDRDVLLQAAGTRLLTVALPTNQTVDFSLVNGTTKPSNNADVTVTAINSTVSATSGGLTLSSTAAIKGGQTAYDTGVGFFLGGSSAQFSVGNSSGNKLTWNGSALGIVGAITGNSSISLTGSAQFDGATTNGGVTYAGVFNNSAASTNGVLGISTGGKAFLGITSTGVGGLGETTSTGIGLHGLNVGNGVGVRAESNPALVPGTALQVVGRMTIDNTTLVPNLNADLLDGNDSTAFATAGHNHTGVYLPIAGTAADSSSLGGFAAAQWIRQTGNTAGNPGTAFTHTLNCVTGAGVTFRIPVFVP